MWATVSAARIEGKHKEARLRLHMARETAHSVPMTIRKESGWEPVGQSFAIRQWIIILALLAFAAISKPTWAERLAEKQALNDKFVRPLCTVHAVTVLWTIWGFRSGTIALIRVFGDRGDFPYLPMWPLPDDSGFLSSTQWCAAWLLTGALLALIVYCLATSSWDLAFDVILRRARPLSTENVSSDLKLEKDNKNIPSAPILIFFVGAVSSCMVVLAVTDRMIWLGFFQMFCAFFSGLLFSTRSSSPMLPFHMFLVCMYAFAGFQKLNVTFDRDIMPWFFDVKVEGLFDLAWILKIPGASICAALTEGFSGLGLLIPRLRKFCALVLCMIHITIIFVLRAKYGGALPHVDVVWQFACLGTLLFLYILPWDSPGSSLSFPKVRQPQAFALVFVFYFAGFAPLLNMVLGIGDCGPAFNMYSGGTMSGHMHVESDSLLDSTTLNRTSFNMVSGGCFGFDRWQSSHLWVSNQEDIFKAGATYLAKKHADTIVNLVLMGKPSVWTGKTDVRYLTCGVRGCSETPCQHHCSAKTSSLFDSSPAPVFINGDTTEGIWQANVESSDHGHTEVRVSYQDGSLRANGATMTPEWCKFDASKSVFDVGGRSFVFKHSDDGVALSLEIDGIEKLTRKI